MNLDFTPEEIAFRNEVREFIRDNYPKELDGIGTREDLTREEFL
ncbi:MAG TPA: pimeloyl-CoA dehydrogenase large subunit, partial [Hyphomonas atlantica]|nr:pimeloyl-CoA dehydrogenase large subunit [Hyphomonas atlantica]